MWSAMTCFESRRETSGLILTDSLGEWVGSTEDQVEEVGRSAHINPLFKQNSWLPYTLLILAQ